MYKQDYTFQTLIFFTCNRYDDNMYKEFQEQFKDLKVIVIVYIYYVAITNNGVSTDSSIGIWISCCNMAHF